MFLPTPFSTCKITNDFLPSSHRSYSGITNGFLPCSYRSYHVQGRSAVGRRNKHTICVTRPVKLLNSSVTRKDLADTETNTTPTFFLAAAFPSRKHERRRMPRATIFTPVHTTFRLDPGAMRPLSTTAVQQSSSPAVTLSLHPCTPILNSNKIGGSSNKMA